MTDEQKPDSGQPSVSEPTQRSEAVMDQPIPMPEPVPVDVKKASITFTKPVVIDPSSSTKKLPPNIMAYPLYGPSGYDKSIVDEAIVQVGSENNVSEAGVDFIRTAHLGENLRLKDRMMDPAIHDDERDWQQGVPYNNGTINVTAPKIDMQQGGILSGIAALHHVNTALGMGSSDYVPLWCSGFQVAFKAPLLTDRHEFDMIAAIKKEKLAWLTAGFSFSASNMVLMSEAIRFALKHLYETSYHTRDHIELMKAIYLPDCYTLLAGFATTIYPDGFPLVRVCPHCRKVYKTLISLPRCMVADNTKLTLEQREILNRLPGAKQRVSPADVERYRSQHKWGVSDNRYEIPGSPFVIYFKVPTIYDAIENADEWTVEIRDTLVESMGNDITDKQRDNYLSERAKRTILRQYGHWVGKINVNGHYIEGKDDINNTLIVMLQNDEVKNGFMSAIRKFIRSSTIGAVVLPAHECEHCQKTIIDDNEGSIRPNDVVLDPLELFFALVTRSVQVTLPE